MLGYRFAQRIRDLGDTKLYVPKGGTYTALLRTGVDVATLTQRLQREGADAFAKSWRALMTRIADKSAKRVAAPAR